MSAPAQLEFFGMIRYARHCAYPGIRHIFVARQFDTHSCLPSIQSLFASTIPSTFGYEPDSSNGWLPTSILNRTGHVLMAVHGDADPFELLFVGVRRVFAAGKQGTLKVDHDVVSSDLQNAVVVLVGDDIIAALDTNRFVDGNVVAVNRDLGNRGRLVGSRRARHFFFAVDCLANVVKMCLSPSAVSNAAGRSIVSPLIS